MSRLLKKLLDGHGYKKLFSIGLFVWYVTCQSVEGGIGAFVCGLPVVQSFVPVRDG